MGDEVITLFCHRTSPHTESAGGTSPHAACKRHSGIDQDATWANRWFELLEQRSLAFEGNSKHKQVSGRAGIRIFRARYLYIRSCAFFDLRGRSLSASSVPRPDDKRLACPCPA